MQPTTEPLGGNSRDGTFVWVLASQKVRHALRPRAGPEPKEMHCSRVRITGRGAVGPATFAIAFQQRRRAQTVLVHREMEKLVS